MFKTGHMSSMGTVLYPHFDLVPLNFLVTTLVSWDNYRRYRSEKNVHRGQGKTSGILLYHPLPYYLEKGTPPDSGARLVANRPQRFPCLSTPIQHQRFSEPGIMPGAHN